MTTGTLEHINITVSDIDRTSKILERMLGTGQAYIALYFPRRDGNRSRTIPKAASTTSA